jgi:adenosylcobinamide-GDP ribazoletransferase
VSTSLHQPQALPTNQHPRRERFGSIFIAFLAALQFLTVMPPLVRRPFTPGELGRAVGWFPLVGLLLGGILAGANLALGLLFPPGVTAALILAMWVLATGALHLDGFLDSCDGLFGGQMIEARLRIMRDERAGAFAVIGGMLLLLLKYACIASLADLTVALVLAPTLGRWGMAVAVVGFPYARPEGLGRALKDHAGWRQLIVATVVAAAASALAAEWLGMVALAVAGATTWAFTMFALGRLGGLTGDIYGALCELSETVVLLVFIAGGMP